MPLPPSLRREVDPLITAAARVGIDPSTVRIGHARGLDAPAATIGEALWFRDRAPPLRTVAHELVHVAQARQHRGASPQTTFSQRSDPAEREAERIADVVASGGTAGAVREAPRARVQRTPDEGTCSPANTASFVLDPAIADVASPTSVSTHVRLAPAWERPGAPRPDRYVVLERPVRAAQRTTLFAVPRYETYLSAAAAQAGRPIVSIDYPQFLTGDLAFTPRGNATVVAVTDDYVITETAVPETVAAGAFVLLTTDAGWILLDGGLQVTVDAAGPVVGTALGRALAGTVGTEPIHEAVLVPGPPSGHALPFLAEHVGIRAIRATIDQRDDGSLVEVLRAQTAYRRWLETALRDDLAGRRATWEAEQPIAANASLREQRWTRHVDAEVARALLALGTPGVALAEDAHGTMVLHDDIVAPTTLPTTVPGAPLELGDDWELDDERGHVVVIGDGRLAVVPAVGMLWRPTRPPPTTHAVPELSATGPLGPGARAPAVTPWMALERIGKQAMLLVRVRGTTGLLVDAGGTPEVIDVNAMAAQAGRLGVTTVGAVAVTHPHLDHVEFLEDLIVRYGIRAENLLVSAAWPARGAGPTGLIGRLRATVDPRFTALGYGASWNPAGIAVGAFGVTHVRVNVPGGAVDVYAHGPSNAAFGSGTVGAADSASLLYVYGNESSGNRTAVIGDLRGTDLLELRNTMETAAPGSFRAAFRGVRVLDGLGHHLGLAAAGDARYVTGLNLLLDATLVQNGALTVLIQSNEGFSFGGPVSSADARGAAFLRYLQRLGVRVIFAGEQVGSGTTHAPAGAVIDSNLAVRPYGAGVQVFEGEPRVAAVHRRLELLREARRTVSDSAEFGPAALELEGRTAAQLTADLGAEIVRLEGLIAEHHNLAAADLADARAPASEPRSAAARRAAFRTTTRTEAQILADLEIIGTTEAQLTTAVRTRLLAAIANGRSMAVDVEFAAMPSSVFAAIEGLPTETRTALAERYRALTELTRTLEGDAVPEARRLEILSRVISLRDQLEAVVGSLTGEARTAADAEVTRLRSIVERLRAETDITTVVGRDVAGRPTRTEYLRLRQNMAVDRAFHGAGRVLGAMMVIHSIEGAVGVTRAGDLNLPETAFRLAHSALGVHIGVRMATTSYRAALAAPVSGAVAAAELAAMVILEFGIAATADYATSEERDAALVNTAITALCMAVGQGIMMLGARVPHPIGRAVTMGLGLAVMVFGERVLRFFGLDDNVERWTSFPPSEVTHVNQRIGAVLREYRLMIGAAALHDRPQDDLTARGAADAFGVQADAGADLEAAARRARGLETTLTELFADAYTRARGSWVGLQVLDQQAAEFHSLRHRAMRGRDDPSRAALEERWASIDRALDLSSADAATIDGMEQWGKLRHKLDELESRLGGRDHAAMQETLDELQLMFENARYRISSADRGGSRPGALIPAGSTAYTAYLAQLRPLEQRLASLQRRLVAWAHADDPALAVAADADSLSVASTLPRLRATRRDYDAAVTALATLYPELGTEALWADPVRFIRAIEDANRSTPTRFRDLQVLEVALRSAVQQTELAVVLAAATRDGAAVDVATRRLVRDDAEAARQAMTARRTRRGLVFLSERDTMVDERTRDSDALLAASIDAAFPSAGRTTTSGLSPEEAEALAAGELGGSRGRGLRPTTSLLAEHRRRLASGFTIDWGRTDLMNPLNHNRVVRRDFWLLAGGFRYLDDSGIDTYPWRDVPAGRTPIVARLLDGGDSMIAGGHHGCNSEYICWTGALYQRVIAVNRDAALLIGTGPVFIRISDLNGHLITEDEIAARAAPPP